MSNDETDVTPEDLAAGDAFREALMRRADGWKENAPYWHGWALMEAYLAGVRRGRRNADATPAAAGSLAAREWQPTMNGVYRLGPKVRGLVREAVAEVYPSGAPGLWLWWVHPEGDTLRRANTALPLEEAIIAAEESLGIQ